MTNNLTIRHFTLIISTFLIELKKPNLQIILITESIIPVIMIQLILQGVLLYVV
jgi:hypothetical protein